MAAQGRAYYQAMKSLAKTLNNLPQKTRAEVVALLNSVLADLIDLHSQTKHAHWNVTGPHFYSLHKLFDELAALVEAHIDPLAERITALGGMAHGTVRQAAKNSGLDEFPSAPTGELGYAVALAEPFSVLGAGVRKSIDTTATAGDTDTADLLTGLSQDLDKGLWLLEAHTRK